MYNNTQQAIIFVSKGLKRVLDNSISRRFFLDIGTRERENLERKIAKINRLLTSDFNLPLGPEERKYVSIGLSYVEADIRNECSFFEIGSRERACREEDLALVLALANTL